MELFKFRASLWRLVSIKFGFNLTKNALLDIYHLTLYISANNKKITILNYIIAFKSFSFIFIFIFN